MQTIKLYDLQGNSREFEIPEMKEANEVTQLSHERLNEAIQRMLGWTGNVITGEWKKKNSSGSTFVTRNEEPDYVNQPELWQSLLAELSCMKLSVHIVHSEMTISDQDGMINFTIPYESLGEGICRLYVWYWLYRPVRFTGV